MDKNITIPFSLFNRIIELLEYWDVPEYTSHFRQDYDDILFALLKKKQSIELRDAYARIVYAKNEDDRFNARMQYLHQKRLANEPF
jgi:hypothetical protein